VKRLSRLSISTPDKSQAIVDGLYENLKHRIEVAPQGNCPVELTDAFLRLCLAQSCGKCVPCRIGLTQLSALMEKVLEGQGTEQDLMILEKAARAIVDAADCTIGREAAKMVLECLKGFRDDFASHLTTGRCMSNFSAVPCTTFCPAHVDIPGYIALVHEGRYGDAVRLIREDNPFPSVCGLICEHPCESHCRRNIMDASVNIRGLKRVAVERAGHVDAPKCAPATGKTVAVIGGGPTGLTAAYFLALMGHSVTVYEKHKKFGGMLRYGIPRYRLPAQFLDEDINVILSTGITAYTDVEIGKDITFNQLQEQFDAVYIAIGAHSYKKLHIPGEDAPNVMSAVQLLGAMGDEEPVDMTGKRVVVVGGGNVAMDACRTALRLGAKSVRCVYRRRQEDMTALSAEIEGAISEGVELVTLKAPVEILTDETGAAKALVVQPQIPGAYRGGRPAPVNADAPKEELACDLVIIAIGQAIEFGHFAECGISASRAGTLQADTSGAVAGANGIYAGGDCASGPATVIKAIEAGKTAAANIDEYFGLHSQIEFDVEVPHAVSMLKEACGRCNMTDRPAAERIHDFALIENVMTDEQARQECSRCLRCDHYGYGSFRGGRKTAW
jgi:NADPH-dependent glutamate synthase beta subunit-like oxidoreductase